MFSMTIIMNQAEFCLVDKSKGSWPIPSSTLVIKTVIKWKETQAHFCETPSHLRANVFAAFFSSVNIPRTETDFWFLQHSEMLVNWHILLRLNCEKVFCVQIFMGKVAEFTRIAVMGLNLFFFLKIFAACK